MSETVLDVRNLHVQFKTDVNLIKAVDGISFDLKRGQTLGIVGESGSGKSVTSLAIMGLVPNPPGRVTGGEIWFKRDEDGAEPIDLLHLPARQMRQYRGNQLAMIFQEPMSSLNPVYTCGFQLTEAIRQHEVVSEAEARRRAIALLQEVKLLPTDEELTQAYVAERSQQNADLPLPTEAEINQHINAQKLAILDRYPHELSGGQIQRVMIAMAISCNPSVLIADEPTTALDVTVQATILDLLRELRDRRGMSIIFVTHDLGIIAEIADEVAVMYQGKIVEYNSVWEIFSNPQHPYTKGLLTCRPRPDQRLNYLPTVADFMEVVTTPTGETVIREKQTELTQSVKAVIGSEPVDSVGNGDRPLAAVPPAEDPSHVKVFQEISPATLAQRLATLQQQSPLLSVNNLQVAFPVRGIWGRAKRYVMAVNGVSFEVYPGETLGLVGESGCGKTTLARTLLQLIAPTHGQIWFDGHEVTALKADQLRRLRREMQIIFQNPYSSLNPRMSVGDAVMEPLKIHVVGNARQRRERAAYLLERVGLSPDYMNRYAHEFSGGQRQRICIARSLALNPKFIICDESVSALDVSVQAQVLNLLKELQGEFGLTYIFISHDLSVVKFMSDRIMVMNRGKIEEIGPAEHIYREPQQEYTRQLISAIPVGSLETIRERQISRGLAVS